MSDYERCQPADHFAWNGGYEVIHGWLGIVATTTSFEAACAVQRLYSMAWERGERPMTSVVIAKAWREWTYYPPMIETQPVSCGGYYDDADVTERQEWQAEAADLRRQAREMGK